MTIFIFWRIITYKMKNITINITSKCNAECRHCCFSCSPSRTTQLDEDEIWGIVNYAINSNDINEVAISGGEPFLYEDLVFRIVKAVADSGKIVTCITNGFWGISYEVARNKIEHLCSLGLNVLTISCDDFHNEYVSIDCIKNILSACIQLPIKVYINMTVTKENTGNDILKNLNDYLLGVQVTRFSAVPVGNALEFNDSDLYYKLDIKNELKCSEPASGMVIHHDGYVYPCCSPLVFDSALRLGSIRDNNLNELNKKFHSNFLIYIIKKLGLNWFVEKCKERGYDKFKNKYISSCQLCAELFKDDYVMNLLYDDMKEYCANELL